MQDNHNFTKACTNMMILLLRHKNLYMTLSLCTHSGQNHINILHVCVDIITQSFWSWFGYLVSNAPMYGILRPFMASADPKQIQNTFDMVAPTR